MRIIFSIVKLLKFKDMKTLTLFALMMITTGSFAQTIKIDSVYFVKNGVEEIILDNSIKNSLEPFKDKDDAIIYLYRLSSMVGGAVKWKIQVDSNDVFKLGQKESVVVHINTAVRSHYVAYPNFKYNYVNFKPNRYYMIRLKGFSLIYGYLTEETYGEIKSCKRIVPLTK
jgi:hypothetical protein